MRRVRADHDRWQHLNRVSASERTGGLEARYAGQAPGGASFIASTGAVCRRRGPEVEAANIYSASVPAIIAAARKRAAIERDGLNELEALAAPSTFAGDWRTYIADAKNALATVTKLGDLGAHPERALLESSYYAYLKALEQLRAAAGQAGLVGCAQYG